MKVKERASKRYEICLSCPSLSSKTKQCKHCSCFMFIKVWQENAVCPEGKWKTIEGETNE